ncbi:MAG TPA: hypothetical protein VFD00_04965 [Thermoclostridium sp.]|nr:hypothetical protein [Thermoclostridium sp.]
MFKKWWFYVIIAVVIVIIAIPISTIIRLNNSVYDDLSFTYVKLEDPLTEIAKKYLYYDANTKTLEIELNQDLINSFVKDELEKTDLGLPDKLSIQEVALKLADQRVYINAKYGSISLPISAKVFIDPSDTGISISVGEFNLGDKKAPKFVTKRLPTDQLSFSFNYADLGLPQLFAIEDIKYSTGNLNAFVKLDSEAIKALAKDYVDELEVEINSYKRTASDSVATFIDRAMAEGILSDANVDKYVEQVLNNEELVNSAVNFIVAKDLDKYSKGFASIQDNVIEWAEPIQTVKFEGTVEDIVVSLIDNNELHEMLAWFIPTATISGYVDTASTYYSLYKNAEGSFNNLSVSLQGGDIERAINQIVADRDLYAALTAILPSDSVNYYIGSIQGYYNMYADITKALTDALDSIPDDEITEYVNQAVKYAYEVDNGKDYIINLLAGVDTRYVQEIIYYLDADDGFIKAQIDMIDPASYDYFMLYVDNIDWVKSEVISSIKVADISAVKEGADILQEINRDLVYVLDLLKDQQYEKAGTAIGNMNFDKAENFIEKQSEQLSASVN